jgi:hypothetical protein
MAEITPTQPTQDPALGIQIDDVNKSLWAYIKSRKLKQFLLLAPVVILWEGLSVFVLIAVLRTQTSSNGAIKGPLYMAMAPVVIFAGWLAKLRQEFEDAFLEEFAKSNGFNFSKNGSVDITYGSIFRIPGTAKQVSDVLTGEYKGADLRIFLFRLVKGSGRNQRDYNDTVVELDLNGKLPNLLMINNKSKLGGLDITDAFDEKHKISLEGDFNDYFTLYGNQNNEIEARQVFTPDTMALMEDNSKHYSVEFGGNRVYIYANGYIGNKQELIGAFTLAKKLIDKIGPLAERLAKDASIIPKPLTLAEVRPNVTRKRTIKTFLAIIIGAPLVLVIFLLIILAIAMLMHGGNN